MPIASQDLQKRKKAMDAVQYILPKHIFLFAKDLHFSFRKTKEYLVDLVHDSRNVSQVQLGVSHGNVQVDALFHDDDPTRSLQYIQVACIQPFHQKLNITPRIVVSLEQTWHTQNTQVRISITIWNTQYVSLLIPCLFVYMHHNWVKEAG